MRIVGKTEIARLLDEGLGKAQQELVRVQQMQNEALNLVKEIQKNKGKVTQKDLDQLIEAEQLQKQVAERLGNRPDEGVRDELAKLQQLIKDNKVPSSAVQDQIKTLKNELERLRRRNCSRSSRTSPRHARSWPAPPSRAPRKRARSPKREKLQEQSKQALDELAKFLDPWAGMHQMKGETRDVLAKQKELQKGVEKILDSKAELVKGDKSPEAVRTANEELKADLDQHAERKRTWPSASKSCST